MSNAELVEEWVNKITVAEKQYEKYYNLVRETREFYKDNAGSSKTEGRYNIFWSGVETQKPFLYFRQPKPYIERANPSAGEAQKLACRILSRALAWNLQQFDFDSVVKYARNDFLISGCGILWEHYEPEFAEFPDACDPTRKIELKTGEKVVSQYVNPEHFIADCDKVGIWEDVSWVARKIYMSKQEAVDAFGEAACVELVREGEKDYRSREICVYEIWDKISRRVYWLAKEKRGDFLKVCDNPLKTEGFFPCPKPIFATLTNDSIIPIPDYSLIKELLNELNGINTRMKLTMQALKVSGAYDNSFPELANILSKDVTLVAAKDFERLKDAGGLRGIIDFVPIEQYVSALEQLAARRQDIIARIYDITGVSDIMRGTSDAAETATAVNQKTNFGTLRNQDRQNDMQRFICDVFRLKAEIICELFSVDTLMSFLTAEEAADAQVARAAVRVLKDDKMRGMVLHVESDNVFNLSAENNELQNGIKVINEMINTALPAVSQQPLLLPLYRQMIGAVCGSLPKGRIFETVLEKVFNDIAADLNRPEPPQQDPAQEIQRQKLEIEREKNRLKARELDIKANAEKAKLELTDKEMNLQNKLKTEEISDRRKAANAEPVIIKDKQPLPVPAQMPKLNTNIPTGLVKSFD
ncbi:MAG: hypothetical protein IJ482_06170 [Alphaproteobacteria bacterium]|nr:hypothetical protein [Alphaproteobacteria bacterium]